MTLVEKKRKGTGAERRKGRKERVKILRRLKGKERGEKGMDIERVMEGRKDKGEQGWRRDEGRHEGERKSSFPLH